MTGPISEIGTTSLDQNWSCRLDGTGLLVNPPPGQWNPVLQMARSSDPLQFVLDWPMAPEPGEAWAYHSGSSMFLGAILDQATGRDLLAYAREVLFDPVGIGPVNWDIAPGGHYFTHGGLSMAPRDMARLGYLMLHSGAREGRQILPADWVARSITGHYAAAPQGFGYGYQWWILPDGRGYSAQGLYDQRIVVLPEADMVVVFTASIPTESFYHIDGLVNSFILPACTDLVVDRGRETYDAYGFTLENPAGFLLTEAPIPGHAALSDASGVVQITSDSEPMELLSVLWAAVEPDEDLGTILDQYLAGLG
jgi:CubicO group peptidase (beta-lactamase class C family)